MREIKFRFYDGAKMCEVGELTFFADRAGYHINGEFPSTGKDPYPLMQTTNLHDKNGKEIYEGDILCVFDEAVVPVTDEGQGPIEPCNHLVPVEMRNGVWGFEISEMDYGETGWFGLHYWREEISNDGFEIIGNIYENPELLK